MSHQIHLFGDLVGGQKLLYLTGFFSESQLILRWLRVNAVCKGARTERNYKNVVPGGEFRLDVSREVKGPCR